MNQVAVIIPTLNEAERIGDLLAQIAQQPADLVLDILVADGGSTDGTQAIVTTAAGLDARIRLVDNPERIQSAGVNRAVALADCHADILIRVDAHAHYPDDYVPRIVAAFAATQANMVAVGLRTVAKTCVQRGIAAASNSRIGTGGAAHRVGAPSGFVDHGHHAGMSRAMFERVGGYDRSFVANEDAELDLRVRKAGGRIWLAADIQVEYLPRSTLRRLFIQYWRYGRGRAQTFRKHGERLRPRQMLPPLLVIALASAILLSPLLPALLLLPLAYVMALSVATFMLWRKSPSVCTLLALPAAATMHIAWGTGFCAALLSTSARPVRSPSPHWSRTSEQAADRTRT
ncbi:glycosyltransferase family 2 protein [Sphingosinicellaceae bacterium]|nr:glycosyltransferase family 2 protein [Sphingosinicellaceae bacterium]